MKKIRLFSMCYFIYASFIALALTINVQADYDAIPEEDEVVSVEAVSDQENTVDASEDTEAEEEVEADN